MTATEKLIIEKKNCLKEFIRENVENYTGERTHIWGNLMDVVLPKIREYEINIISTFSTEFGSDFKKQISHYWEMRKHLKEVNEYYDNLIKEYVN